jgi:hypothetical protein
VDIRDAVAVAVHGAKSQGVSIAYIACSDNGVAELAPSGANGRLPASRTAV